MFAEFRGEASSPALMGAAVRRAVWPLHLARQIAYSLYGRPISAGNDTYIRECLTGLAALRRRAAVSAVPAIAAGVDQVLRASSREALERLMRTVDETGYQSWPGVADARPLRFGRLRGARFRKLIFVVGPGIGLGDEIAVLPFQRMLSAAFPDAAVEVYTSYPALWHAAAPGVRTRNQVNRPDKAYERIEELTAVGEAQSTLAAFINFSGLEMLLPYRLAGVPMPMLEYAVGLGRIDFLPPGEPLERLITLEQEVPSMVRARDALIRHLLGTRDASGDTPPAPRPRGAADFVLVVNPLTSKEMPLLPPGWARLVRAVRNVVPRRRRLIVRVYPGLSPAAREIAAAVTEACDTMRLPGVAVEPMVSPIERLTSGTAVSTTLDALANADLLLGMDTFSAHLAATIATPSVAVCLTRNPLFWESAAGSFWIDVGTGVDTVAQLLGSVAGAITGRPPALLDGIVPEACRAAMGAETVAAAASPFDVAGATQRRAYSALDEIWTSLRPAARALFLRTDASYAWPSIRGELAPTTPLRCARIAGARLADSMFFRLLRMAAS